MICLPLFKLQTQIHKIYLLYIRENQELFAWNLQTGRDKLYYVICFEICLQTYSKKKFCVGDFFSFIL